jgi:pimeloyl-ACP methyl ester carboxylesterase
VATVSVPALVLERSAHFPMWDEPEAFAREVNAFLDALP